MKNRENEIKELIDEFKPYDKDFSHEDWITKVSKLLDREKMDEMCGDYFYDGDCLGWYLIGRQEEKQQLKKLIDKLSKYPVDQVMRECGDCKSGEDIAIKTWDWCLLVLKSSLETKETK